MTKEEVIRGLKENLCAMCAYGSQNMDTCDIRGCDNRDFIKALEQEPKTGHWIHHKETPDCVEHWECSRCHRNTTTNPFIVHGNDYDAMYYCPKCGAEMAESEELELKTGHWIHHEETLERVEHWECSRCHRNTTTCPFIVNGNDYDAMYYCPKCGAEMVESEANL